MITEVQLASIDQLAANYHQGQTRHDGVSAYIGHPREVESDLANDGFDTHMRAAALLHDVPEDQPVTIQNLFLDLADIISIEDATIVVDLVIGMTSPDKFFEVKKHFNRKQRKAMMRAHFSVAGWKVAVIKLYDRWSNVRDMGSFEDEFKSVYIQETAALLGPLEDVINEAYFEGKAKAQAVVRKIYRRCFEVAIEIGQKK